MVTHTKTALETEETESIDRVLAIFDAIVPRVGFDKAVAATLTNTVVYDLHCADFIDEDEDEDEDGKG